MKIDRIVVALQETINALEDTQYQMDRLYETNEIFSSSPRVKRKISGANTAIRKALRFIIDATEEYRFSK